MSYFSHDMGDVCLRDLGIARGSLNDLEGPMAVEKAPEVFHHQGGLVHRG